MSTIERYIQPGLQPWRETVQQIRPQLRVLSRRPMQLGNTAFTILILVMLFAAVLFYLAIQTALSQSTYVEQQLQAELRTTTYQVQELQQQTTVMANPGTLLIRARELGMVPMKVPVFLRLSDGAILGNPKPADTSHEDQSIISRLDPTAVALTSDGSAQLQASQLPVDDGAVLVHKAVRP